MDCRPAKTTNLLPLHCVTLKKPVYVMTVGFSLPVKSLSFETDNARSVIMTPYIYIIRKYIDE